jgi:hypothetical protein
MGALRKLDNFGGVFLLRNLLQRWDELNEGDDKKRKRGCFPRKGRIYRQAVWYNMSSLNDDSLSLVTTADQVEVQCPELVISTSSVDSYTRIRYNISFATNH